MCLFIRRKRFVVGFAGIRIGLKILKDNN